MQFTPDTQSASPIAEWMARISPVLAADDPHQRCIAAARDQGIHDVNQVCTCPVSPCTKECCQ